MSYSAMQDIKIVYSLKKKKINENLLAVPPNFRGPRFVYTSLAYSRYMYL
jgi:hypothetical protein